ncbi:MAG TPA: hypothetical protein VGY56_10860 [Verrucomicrobiae bacterium]|nr:hypothetical protein [Verrucomicrobiae bacterium]
MKLNSSPIILAVRLVVAYSLAHGVRLCAQNTVFVSAYGPPPDGTNVTMQAGGRMVAGGGMAISINGQDIGTILLKACDQDQDGKVTLTELENTVDSYFKLWDADGDGNLSTNELAAGLKGLFPPPPPGGAQAVAVVNGVAVQIPADEIRTPDQMITENIMAAADANKDGLLSLQELNDWLSNSFSQWDQNGDGTLDASELGAAFGQLARPD